MFHRSHIPLPLMPVAAAVLLLTAGCGSEPAPWWTGTYDLSGIAISDELSDHLVASLTALESAAPVPRATDLAAYEDLLVRVRPPETRRAAGDEIYARWRAEPTNVLWLELAKNYDFLLRRRDDLEAMCATPGLDDPDTPLGAYVAGRLRFRHGDRGELYRRAEKGAAELDPLTRVWLQYKLSEVDNEGGDTLAGARRLLMVLPEARSVGGPRLEASAWYRVARLLLLADRLDDALHAATLAAVLQTRTGSDYALLRTRIRLADIREARREYGSAREDLLALADEAAARRFDWLEQTALDKAAAVAGSQGDYAFALELDRRGLARVRALGDPLNLPRMLATVAHDHRMLGDLDSCRIYLLAAKEQVDAYPDERNVSRMNSLLAEYYCLVGRYEVADSLLAVAAGQVSTAGTATDEARILLELLPQALETGRADLAYRWLNRLDELTGSLHDQGLDENLRADYWLASLRLLPHQGEFRRAAEALAAAEAAVAAAGGEGKAWEVNAAAGELALLRGDLVAAEASYRHCLELATDGTDPDLVARSRRQLGQVMLARGQTAAARELFRPPDDDTTFGHRFSNRLYNLLLTGESYLVEGRTDAARTHFMQALSLAGPHTPADLVARGELGLGRSLVAAGEPHEALVALERARVALARAPGRTSFADVAAYLADDERDAREAFAGLLLDHSGLAGGSESAAAALAVARPEIANLPTPRPGAPRLVYFVGRFRSFVWVVTAAGTGFEALPGEPELRSLLAPVIADMTTPGRGPDQTAAVRLSAILTSGLMESWSAGAVLTVAPDGVLHGVPWSALPWPPDDGDGLVLDHGPVVVSTGEPASPVRPGGPGQWPLLAIGSDGRPDGGAELQPLRHAEAEARLVAALWPAEQSVTRLGEAAGWEGLASVGLRRFGIIHVATHASVHQGLPGQSTLRFARGRETEPVTIPAVAGLQLTADLVYLSCCHAGRQLGSRGSGAADFAGAFLAAGARSVVASTMWIDDAAAAALAERFYGHWLAGAGKADALWNARRDLRATREEWRHPAYWAFTRLVGAAD